MILCKDLDVPKPFRPMATLVAWSSLLVVIESVWFFDALEKVPSVGLVDVSTTTVGSTRQCANTARSALPLSMVLVLACCLPDVTPSAPGKHEVDDFLGVHTTSCWCQAACGSLGADHSQ